MHSVDLFNYHGPYVVTGDGQRFYFTVKVPGPTAPIHLVLNWTAG